MRVRGLRKEECAGVEVEEAEEEGGEQQSQLFDGARPFASVDQCFSLVHARPA